MQLVECVPNFSEGRDKTTIRTIVSAIEQIPGIRVLHVDIGLDANRTVVTFTGPPDAAGEAAFQAIRTAARFIDLRRHSGTHPRMGATDVCPFVPLRDISIEECVKLSEHLARRVGEELGIPVFLYAESASLAYRRNLAEIRRGEYEGMKEKLRDPVWHPDYGPGKLHEQAGCIAIGARNFLIAYNVNLKTTDVAYARDIALEVRTKGRTVRTGNTNPLYFMGEQKRHEKDRYFCSSCVFSAQTVDHLAEHIQSIHGYDLYQLLGEHNQDPAHLEGEPVKRPGKLPHVKALGWYVEEYGCTQVSMNLTDFTKTPLHRVYEEIKQEAKQRGVAVSGSEIVGMVPYDALRETGEYYLRKAGCSVMPEPVAILETAIASLGLRDKGDFKIAEKVLGFPVSADETATTGEGRH